MRHNEVISSLEQRGGEETEEMSVPRPRLPQLVNKDADRVGEGARYLEGPSRSRSSSPCSSNLTITAKSLKARGWQLISQLEPLDEVQMELKMR